MRTGMMSGLASTTRQTPPCIVIARGWFAPMPPRPAVKRMRPAVSRRNAAPDRAQRLKRPLDDALRPDVLPRRSGVLGEHRQVLVLQLVEDGPGGLHDIGGRHHDARGQAVRPEDGDGHARLHHQRFVVLQILQRIDDGPVRLPVAGALADAAIDHETLGLLGVLHVVLEKAQDDFLSPSLASEGRSATGPHREQNISAQRTTPWRAAVARRARDGDDAVSSISAGGTTLTEVKRTCTVNSPGGRPVRGSPCPGVQAAPQEDR
jgi:hypothetical protein